MRNQIVSALTLALTSAALPVFAPCFAQQVASVNERVVLESRAARAESAAKRSDIDAGREASALRARLRDGDFHPGDRVTISVAGEAAMSNTFLVRAGNVLNIPSLPEISLRGVLRSELRDVLIREIGRYIKQPEVQVTTLVNVAVLGAVTKPGFYMVAPDAPITDVLMAAGGPAGNSDLGLSRLMRDGVSVADGSQVRRLLESSYTLDDVGIQSGDQLIIGEQTHRWQGVSALVGIASLITTTYVLLRRH